MFFLDLSVRACVYKVRASILTGKPRRTFNHKCSKYVFLRRLFHKQHEVTRSGMLLLLMSVLLLLSLLLLSLLLSLILLLFTHLFGLFVCHLLLSALFLISCCCCCFVVVVLFMACCLLFASGVVCSFLLVASCSFLGMLLCSHMI